MLACNREGCENILCGRYSPTHGYICEECFEELVETLRKHDVSVRHFMHTPKHAEQHLEDDKEMREYLEKVFPVS